MDEGDAEALSALDDDLAQRGIVAPAELREAIDEYARPLELRDTFEQFILSQQKEVMETPLLEEFISDFDFLQPSHFLIGWLQRLEEAGKIQRYKQANRWRIQVRS